LDTGIFGEPGASGARNELSLSTGIGIRISFESKCQCLVVFGFRILWIVLLFVGEPPSRVSADGARRDGCCGIEVVERTIQLPAFPEGLAAATKTQCRIGNEANGLVEIGKRSVQVPLEPPDLTSIAERTVLFGVQQQRLAIVGDGLIQIPLVLPDQRPVDESI